ncbi:hypothetical protein J4H92_13475 [Leucobacter weissii]|uniref:Secreted protein n=1 Tax=Leucobacter weissii TaxID=1983706 RepID=A0A939SD29_9MICO|nr:hypothetical protein [Leucobacter weissii]MBO1902953.1 hypothetical protein [Leucobacter weissii]
MRITQTPPARAGGAVAAIILMLVLSACAPEADPAVTTNPPTMAPEQSVEEACAISRAEIERVAGEAEEDIRTGVEQAGEDLLAGKTPSFDFLAPSVGDALGSIEEQVTNDQVRQLIEELQDALSGFAEIETPATLLETPEYLGALNEQLKVLSSTDRELRLLCE